MKFCKLAEGIVADDIGVEDEEWRVILSKSLLCQFERTCGPQWFCLNGNLDIDIVFFSILWRKRISRRGMGMNSSRKTKATDLLQGRCHGIWAVIDRQDNVSHTGSCQALYLMEDHGAVGKLDERLWKCESLATVRSFALGSSSAPSGIKFLPPVFSRMGRTRGRSRVPYPPTRMRATKISLEAFRSNARWRWLIPFILSF